MTMSNGKRTGGILIHHPRSRKKLFVHVGYPKTGTTSIQRSFYCQRYELAKSRQLLYPEPCLARPEFGHHNIAWEALSHPLFNPENGTDYGIATHRMLITAIKG